MSVLAKPPLPRKHGFRAKVHELVEAPPVTQGKSLDWFDVTIYLLIVLNVLAVILETVESLSAQYASAFAIFETLSVAIFALEYLLRIWSCTVDERYHHPIWGRLKFARSPFAIIDLLAISPFFLPLLLPDLRVIRILRMLRMLRALKLGRYSHSAATMGRVFRAKRDDLVVILAVAAMLVIIASTLMYFAEHESQPEQFSSIPASFWWAVMTLTTVGYGDVYPITSAGRVLAAFIAFAGIGLFALPAGLLASAFAQELERQRRQPARCPHCGKETAP